MHSTALCGRTYSDESARIQHELHDEHLCGVPCNRCEDAKVTLAQRREQQEQAKARALQERLAQRTAAIEQTVTLINTTDWQERVEQTIDLPNDDVLRQQAHTLLRNLYKGETVEECIVRLLAGEERVLQYLVQHLPQMHTLLAQAHQPTLAALLAYKDTMCITDALWWYTVSLFRLGEYASIGRIRRIRDEINARMPATNTPGGQGSQLPLMGIIKWMIQQAAPKTTNLVIKFAFDGALVTSKRRITEEIGTTELVLESATLAQTRSVKNCYQYVIYLGGESVEEYRKELEDAIPVINGLISNGEVEVDGVKYTLEPVLVCDMKALVKVMGFYTCFHPKAKWKCPWCPSRR